MPKPELRNVNPPLSEWRFWAFWSLITVAGAALMALSVPDLWRLGRADASLWIIFTLPLLLELGPLFRGRWERPNGLSSSLMFVFALLLHWGFAVAVTCYAISLILEFSITRGALWRPIFNIAQFTASMGVAHLALVAFGQRASLTAPAAFEAATLPALLVAGVLYLAVNLLLVGTIMALRYHTPWWSEVTADVGFLALNDGAAIALAPLVVLAAERSPWVVPLLLIPLYAVYKSNVASLALKHQAGHDGLTGLPNRSHLLERANQVFAGADTGGAVAGLFVLDLDRFKEINDTLGHPAGDGLLKIVADRLAGAVRPGDLVARLGGDEFAVLLPNAGDEVAARAVAGRITAALRAPMRLAGVLLSVDCSLGIALAPEHGSDFETLLQRADLAMYSAKHRGTSIETYSAELASGPASHLNVVADLRRALQDSGYGELALHYQPQLALDGRRPVGVEALLRWTHPVRGLVPPDEFIGAVEHTSFMSALTQKVIDEALGQVARWAQDRLYVRVAVNVNVTDLHRPDFAEYVAQRLQHHRVEPAWLQLEISERTLMVDPGPVLATVRALETLGVSLLLDDFGTGYSSMSQLRRLPVAEIKIDRSFISAMHASVDDYIMVRSMIELARALGLRVVAEGVENQPTWDHLVELRCDGAQGGYIADALPEPQITAWLHEHRRHPRALRAVSHSDIG